VLLRHSHTSLRLRLRRRLRDRQRTVRLRPERRPVRLESSDQRGRHDAGPGERVGPTDYEALFDAPGDPTTTDDLVTGVWAGKTSYADVRLKLTANRIIVALKCDGAQATGLEFGAIVTSTQLKVLASKSVDGYYCGINVSPTVIRRCTTSFAYDCFDVSGTTLRFNDAELFTSYGSSANMSYTKLSD
jgi:hypothetical protein